MSHNQAHVNGHVPGHVNGHGCAMIGHVSGHVTASSLTMYMTHGWARVVAQGWAGKRRKAAGLGRKAGIAEQGWCVNGFLELFVTIR